MRTFVTQTSASVSKPGNKPAHVSPEHKIKVEKKRQRDRKVSAIIIP